ncbi:MAG: hypothetical protein WC967_05070 [Balneolaceae bacterium]
MKSFKSLFALLAIASLSFACSSVTDASFNDDALNAPVIEQATPGNVNGIDPDPIILKPVV